MKKMVCPLRWRTQERFGPGTLNRKQVPAGRSSPELGAAVEALRSQPRNITPLAIAALGGAALVVSLPFGARMASAGAALFLVTALLAMVATRTTLWTWGNAMALLTGVIWLVPIRLYRLPIDVGIGIEPYRVLVLLLVVVLVVWAASGRGSINACGAERPLILLASAAIVTQIVNYQDLTGSGGESAALKALSYFLSMILVFLLVASLLTTRDQIDSALRTLVAGAVVVALFAIYEGRTNYNVFNHLNEWVPLLEKQPREVYDVRGGLLRVHASAQHPIALGVALAMMVPFAFYLAGRAHTVVRSRLWVAAAGVVSIGAISTISRTTVLVFATMMLAALVLRGAMVRPFWPLLIVLPLVAHLVAPGAMGGLYKSFSPRGGLAAELEGRPGLPGSGRLADIDPALRLWEESPIVGHGLGGLPTAPVTPGSTLEGAVIIFDNQYMSTLVARAARADRRSGSCGAAWSSSCAPRAARRAAQRPDGGLLRLGLGFGAAMMFFDAFAFVQCTLVFVFLAPSGSASAGASSPGGRPG